jgi:hypothetical protein
MGVPLSSRRFHPDGDPLIKMSQRSLLVAFALLFMCGSRSSGAALHAVSVYGSYPATT